MHSVQHLTIASAALDCLTTVTVLLPCDDEDGRRYPVLYLLHSLASPPSPSLCATVRDHLRDLPFIIVLPDGDRSFYINTIDGRRYEDYMSKELVPAVDRTFPSVPLRTCRAIGGPSMGGFGALMLALRHRDLFGVVYSQSGAIGAPRWVIDGPNGCVFGAPDSPLRSKYDLYQLAVILNDLPAIYLDCGLDDFLLAENREFHTFLQARGIAHVYREHMGEHPGPYLNEASQYALDFVRDTISLPQTV